MPKVVINSEPGGFSLSHHGLMLYAKLKKLNIQVYSISEGGLYEIYKKKIGREIPNYLLFHCILPVGETFSEKVDEVFLKSNLLNIGDYYFLIQPDGKKLLNEFRSDPSLVRVVEELQELSWGEYAHLKVLDIPDDVIWEIWHLDSGTEIVKEVSREWR